MWNNMEEKTAVFYIAEHYCRKRNDDFVENSEFCKSNVKEIDFSPRQPYDGFAKKHTCSIIRNVSFAEN